MTGKQYSTVEVIKLSVGILRTGGRTYGKLTPRQTSLTERLSLAAEGSDPGFGGNKIAQMRMPPGGENVTGDVVV